MSIEKTWVDMNDKGDDELSSLLQTGGLPKRAPKNPLEKIRKNLLTNMIWTALICAGYIVIISCFHFWQVQVLLGVVLAFSLWALYDTWLQYKKLTTTVSASGSLLEELKRHHQSISNWMKVQQRAALFIYPISAAGGFLLGGVWGSGKSVEFFMHKTAAMIALPIAIVVLTPTAYYLGRWMFNHSFGKHMTALQKNINDLEADK